MLGAPVGPSLFLTALTTLAVPLLVVATLPACEKHTLADFGAAPQITPHVEAAEIDASSARAKAAATNGTNANATSANGAARAGEDPDVTSALPSCPDGMIEVEGDFCPRLEQSCKRWLPSVKNARRCAEFVSTSKCLEPTVHKHFCIDRYEYPNVKGALPKVLVSWNAARDTCREQGKRLCGDSEWTLACEGPDRLPYPHGYARGNETCNIDKEQRQVDEKALGDPRRRDAEAARLWQGEPSGSRPACLSAFGVADMSGNVDEWVVNESGKPFASGSKGGYWGPVRDRCRPMTRVHNEEFSFYQTGFRCCGDPIPSAP